MSTVNQKRAKSTNIYDHLRRRPRRDRAAGEIAAIRRRRRRERKLRRGGLRAERDVDAKLADAARTEARRIVLSRTGRRIDLVSLLRQRRPDGKPRWTVVDPTREISKSNGGYDRDGDLVVADYHCVRIDDGHKHFRPHDGFPALPPAVRRMATDRKIRKRAEWVGVLYQPEEWHEVNPDPALVVKWKGVEGYFALAVWGGDRARIMEFVD